MADLTVDEEMELVFHTMEKDTLDLGLNLIRQQQQLKHFQIYGSMMLPLICGQKF